MHDTRSCYGAALCEANRWQRRNPRFAAILRAGGPQADELRARFLKQPAVACFVRHAKYTPGHVDAVQLLAVEAEDWQDRGQFTALGAMWDRWRTKGVLDDLSRTDRPVLQALVMMAMRDRAGPQVIASLHYVRVVVESEFDLRISHETVRAAYRRLAARNLLEVLPGSPGSPGNSRRSSTRVDFRCSLEPMSGWPSAEAFADLTMLPETITAASAYRVEAYAARAVAQRQLEKAYTGI